MSEPKLANEGPEQQIDSTIIKLAEQYASCDRRSADINDERATIRENIEKLGIPSKSFVHAVMQVKQMSRGERNDYQTGVNRVLSVIADRQMELYPEETKKQQKRDEERAAAEAEAAAKAGVDADTNPRSDPESGGAGKRGIKKPKTLKEGAQASDAALAESIKNVNGRTESQDSEEQAEGEQALNEMAPSIAH